ncbi:MAG: hypothetical protein QOG13_726 [Sphingomonadales bacterium]|jgi:hypothetical protein|nr:hypothetical protein [Sphingomonadales bacterium]
MTERGHHPTPFGLRLSKPSPAPLPQKEGKPFDMLRANGVFE